MKLNTTILAVLTASIGAASAASISVNFSENSANQNWNSVEDIGPVSVSTSYFNNTNDPTGGPANTHTGSLGTGTLGDLVDSTGVSAAGTVVTYSSSGAWYNTAGTASNEAKLQVGYLDDGAGGVNISMSNIPYAQYDVYLILASGQGDTYRSLGFDVNGSATGNVDAYGFLGSDAANTSWTEATDTTRGNYILVTGQTASTLTIQGQERNLTERGSIAGFQVVEVPEPSSAALLGLGGLALILRRRK